MKPNFLLACKKSPWTLTLTLTLTLTGGNFPRGQIFRTPAKAKETKNRKEKEIIEERKKTEDAKFCQIKTNFSEKLEL